MFVKSTSILYVVCEKINIMTKDVLESARARAILKNTNGPFY